MANFSAVKECNTIAPPHKNSTTPGYHLHLDKDKHIQNGWRYIVCSC